MPSGSLGCFSSGLNAPFGAQCFPTCATQRTNLRQHIVSMHLLVLSAFRPEDRVVPRVFHCLNAPFGAQCFPTGIIGTIVGVCGVSQCTFWCSVLSDRKIGSTSGLIGCLNAPFGAQCFPTSTSTTSHGTKLSRSLNAPFGAQCFPTENSKGLPYIDVTVSMHLLVLSAFRPAKLAPTMFGDDESQCTFWCSVLSDESGQSDRPH